MDDQLKSGMWLMFAIFVQLLCVLLTIHMLLHGSNAVSTEQKSMAAFKVLIALILSYVIAFMMTRYILQQANAGNPSYQQDLIDVFGGKTALLICAVLVGIVSIFSGTMYIHRSLHENQHAHMGLLAVPTLVVCVMYAGIFSANSAGRTN